MTVSGDTLEQSYRHGLSALRPTAFSKPLKTYLFGHPISHSLAPILHSTIWNGLDVPWTYSLIDSLHKTDFLPHLRSSNCIGAAVTMPHKVSIMSEVDELTEEARMIGAVNTIFVRETEQGVKKYIGANTDCIGIREAFEQNFPGIAKEIRGRAALVIGAGGACRSAIYALWYFLEAKEIYLVNRFSQEIEEVVLSLTEAGFPGKLTHIHSLEAARLCEAPVAIVGTVPDSEAKEVGEILAKRIVLELLKTEKKGFVLDMCYHPSPFTSFMKLSLQNGWKVIPGTEALIHQGIAQDVLWMEKPMEDLPIEDASRAVRAALKIE